MKKIFWLLPLFVISCKNDKAADNGATHDAEGNQTENTETGDSEQAIIDELTSNVGRQYTDLEMPTIEGSMAKLSDFVSQNKVTVIDCWASWCRPCMEEMPNIAKLYRKYRDLGVGVVGVSFDNDPRAWNNAVKINEMIWPQLGELKGWDNQMFNVYGVQGIPHTIVINQKGEIIAEGLRGEDLINAVAKAL